MSGSQVLVIASVAIGAGIMMWSLLRASRVICDFGNPVELTRLTGCL